MGQIWCQKFDETEMNQHFAKTLAHSICNPRSNQTLDLMQTIKEIDQVEALPRLGESLAQARPTGEA